MYQEPSTSPKVITASNVFGLMAGSGETRVGKPADINGTCTPSTTNSCPAAVLVQVSADNATTFGTPDANNNVTFTLQSPKQGQAFLYRVRMATLNDKPQELLGLTLELEL
jgi:hypothetical protein